MQVVFCKLLFTGTLIGSWVICLDLFYLGEIDDSFENNFIKEEGVHLEVV
jgi:hypothetical protein